jgi:hypothetical protein
MRRFARVVALPGPKSNDLSQAASTIIPETAQMKLSKGVNDNRPPRTNNPSGFLTNSRDSAIIAAEVQDKVITRP